METLPTYKLSEMIYKARLARDSKTIAQAKAELVRRGIYTII